MKFWEDEKGKILREVSVHAETEDEARVVFQHDFPNVSHFELITR